MSTITSPLTDEGRTATGEALQATVVDLIDLALTAKQLHWHTQGPRFRDVHLQLDVVVEIARRFTDVFAERAVTIGCTVDGRPATVASDSGVTDVSTGYQAAGEVVHTMSGILQGVSERMQRRIDATGDTDPVSQDLLIAGAMEVQEQSWWFQAMDA